MNNIPKSFFQKLFGSPVLSRFANGVLTTLCVGSFLRSKKSRAQASAETFAKADASTTYVRKSSQSQNGAQGVKKLSIYGSEALT
ncbi:MAG: hypothetical protein IKS15_01860 [Opitutales bacterium]|nr:hypothetical protein [Opitutales bacterium]